MIKKFLILFLFAPILLAFSPQDDMELLRSVFKNINDQSKAVSPEQVFYINYSLSTGSTDSTEQPVNSTIEVWTKNKLVEVKNPEMQVFQDEKEVFILLPAKHLILRNDAASMKKTDIAGKKMLAMYDTLLQYSRITASEKVKAKGYDKHISIALTEKGRELMGISKADYYIDSQARAIKKVSIYYSGESSQHNAQIAYVNYTINKIEYDHKGKKLNSNVASAFISNNKLKESYKGYTLMDNRGQAKGK
jgi:hypothetical protein